MGKIFAPSRGGRINAGLNRQGAVKRRRERTFGAALTLFLTTDRLTQPPVRGAFRSGGRLGHSLGISAPRVEASSCREQHILASTLHLCRTPGLITMSTRTVDNGKYSDAHRGLFDMGMSMLDSNFALPLLYVRVSHMHHEGTMAPY